MSTKRQRVGYWKYTHGYSKNKARPWTVKETIFIPLILVVTAVGGCNGLLWLLLCAPDVPLDQRGLGCGVPFWEAEGIEVLYVFVGIILLIWIGSIIIAIENANEEKKNRQ